VFNVWAPKIAAFLAALVVTYAAKHGLTLSETELAGVFLAVLGTVKTLLNTWLNPANVASGELAQKGIAEKRQAKAARAARRNRGI
jgi:hypothetical protein